MIQIKWTEIKIDVDKQTWRIAKVKIGDPELRSDAQEERSKTSETLVMRFAESGFAMVSMAIREQLQNTIVDVATDELDMEKEKWTFTLKDNSNIDERALAMLIHNFIVAYILYQWSMLWASDLAKQFKDEYTDALASIVDEAFGMSEPTKSKRTLATEDTDTEVEVSYE